MAAVRAEPYFLVTDEALEIRYFRDQRASARVRVWQARGRDPVVLVEPADELDPSVVMTKICAAIKWGWLGGREFALVERDRPGHFYVVRAEPCGPRFFARCTYRKITRADFEAEIGQPLED